MSKSPTKIKLGEDPNPFISASSMIPYINICVREAEAEAEADRLEKIKVGKERDKRM